LRSPTGGRAIVKPLFIRILKRTDLILVAGFLTLFIRNSIKNAVMIDAVCKVTCYYVVLKRENPSGRKFR
jgi:hypothetical protein